MCQCRFPSLMKVTLMRYIFTLIHYIKAEFPEVGKVQACPEVEPWDAILYLTCPSSWPFLCRFAHMCNETQPNKGGGRSNWFSLVVFKMHYNIFFSFLLWDSLS